MTEFSKVLALAADMDESNFLEIRDKVTALIKETTDPELKTQYQHEAEMVEMKVLAFEQEEEG